MAYYDQIPGVTGKLSQLEDELRRASSNRRMENAVVGAGGVVLDGGAIVVNDSAGDPAAVIGQLDNGQRGIAVVGASGFVTFDQLAFGTRVVRNAAMVSCGDPGTYPGSSPKNVWNYLGPDINGVRVTGGRLTVMVSALMGLGGEGAVTGFMAVRVQQTDGGHVRSPQFSEALSQDFRGGSMGTSMGATRELIYEGLPEGTYNIQAAYYAAAPGSPGGQASFESRQVSARLL